MLSHFKGTAGRPGTPGSKGLPGVDRDPIPVPGKKGNSLNIY